MASPNALVPSKSIERASLHVRLPRWQHLYAWPFLSLYPLWLAVYVSYYDQYLGSVEYTFVSLGFLLVANFLTFLVGQWSVPIKARTTCQRTTDVNHADVILVTPVKHQGKSQLCPLHRGPPTTHHPEGPLYFEFQKKRYTYEPAEGRFVKIRYPTKDRPTLDTFQTSRGLTTATAVTECAETYGANRFDVPIPTFQELFKEHAVAPFFVFQIFCVGLWFLDEYWYYSLFTLCMLVVFESTLVFQRQRTLKEFRSLALSPFELQVYREGRWIPILSDQLLPGDLCSITRSQGEAAVPCDMLLVGGTCIVNEAMLSGESTPLLKESIALREPTDRLDMTGADKVHTLFGGTKILQVTPLAAAAGDRSALDCLATSGAPPPPPDGGCTAYVLRTGFGSAQGKLVRTMIFNTDRVSANNAEALLFILFLLIFALAAASYVWNEGMNNPKRKKFKVILDCIMIVTSVVPPELPMELSLAVNTSLVALSRYAIFCTEPFRIPFAGKLDICCFDKTGTLTGENLVVEGVAGIGPELTDLYAPNRLPQETTLTLSSAHALVLMDDDAVVGDPMEKVALQAVGWQLQPHDVVVPSTEAKDGSVDSESGPPTVSPTAGLTVLRRYQFSSALKRMSTIVRYTDRATTHPSQTSSPRHFAAVKGAPETLQTMFSEVPAGYEAAYKSFSRRGSRVLALGFKPLTGVLSDSPTEVQLNAITRETVESELRFVGFLVFHCPLKPDSKRAIEMLNNSSHRVVMITGDNPLTACHIAGQLDIVTRPVLVLDVHHDGGVTGKGDVKQEEQPATTELRWTSIDETVVISQDPAAQTLPADLTTTYDLCLTGGALAVLENDTRAQPLIEHLISHVWVYARVSPGQKEAILTTMKSLGFYTLMCGDGTNDVGALKQAHVGVALLDGQPEDLARIAQRQQIDRMKAAYESQLKFSERFGMPPPAPHPTLKAIMDAEDRKKCRAEKRKKKALKTVQASAAGEDNGEAEKSAEAAGEKAVAVDVTAAGGEATKTKKKKKKTKSSKSTEVSQTATAAATTASPSAPGAPGTAKANEALQNLIQQLEMDDEVPTIKFGDASVASPFTSKLSTVMSVCNIVRQGRCTLVATLQMYKILALNSLISAYSLSVLYLDGIKFGDTQVTILGILVAVCFMCISRASPREELSRQRPQSNIFNPYIILSVMGQFAVHIAALIYVTQGAKRHDAMFAEGTEVELDAEFAPSLLNTAVYLISLSMQISTFAINYQGYPFRESLQENKVLYRGLLLVGGIAVLGATELVSELNELMKFVPLPPAFKPQLLMAMVLDFGVAWGIEWVCSKLFSDNRPKDIVLRR
ncbi:putative cation-transporting ATPase 1 [Tieghemiomyces parasiticus]|uniref:Cation-transporting ATPase 1 n=1 Tax=Tieghemiomyces parasiticus TaxID=78921 RepID=A0A9W7ZUQ6_9FUNG|nr:putative cation-transporting ATPase 1 [Tieghemiomyces parasiticus]